jgi:hypothetical protein
MPRPSDDTLADITTEAAAAIDALQRIAGSRISDDERATYTDLVNRLSTCASQLTS